MKTIQNVMALVLVAVMNTAIAHAQDKPVTDTAIFKVSGVCNQCKALIANANIIKVVLLDTKGNKHEYLPEKDWNVHPIDI